MFLLALVAFVVYLGSQQGSRDAPAATPPRSVHAAEPPPKPAEVAYAELLRATGGTDPTPVPAALALVPPWWIRDSIAATGAALTRLRQSRNAAATAGVATIDLAALDSWVDEGRVLVSVIARKLVLLAEFYGADVRFVPSEIQRYLVRDDQLLRQLTAVIGQLSASLYLAVGAAPDLDGSGGREVLQQLEAMALTIRSFAEPDGRPYR